MSDVKKDLDVSVELAQEMEGTEQRLEEFLTPSQMAQNHYVVLADFFSKVAQIDDFEGWIARFEVDEGFIREEGEKLPHDTRLDRVSLSFQREDYGGDEIDCKAEYERLFAHFAPFTIPYPHLRPSWWDETEQEEQDG